MQFYSIAISAHKHGTNYMKATWCRAADIQGAEKRAIYLMNDEFPYDDGYRDHHFVVNVVPNDMLVNFVRFIENERMALKLCKIYHKAVPEHIIHAMAGHALWKLNYGEVVQMDMYVTTEGTGCIGLSKDKKTLVIADL